MASSNKVKAIVDMYNRMQGEMQNTTKNQEITQEVIDFFFEGLSDRVGGIYLCGYTPGFNDGSPCEHTQGEPVVLTRQAAEYIESTAVDIFEADDAFWKLADYDFAESIGATDFLKKLKELEEIIEENQEWRPIYNYQTREYVSKNPEMTEIYEKACSDRNNLRQEFADANIFVNESVPYMPGDIFKAIFGTDVAIIVKRDGINTWQYDCGY